MFALIKLINSNIMVSKSIYLLFLIGLNVFSAHAQFLKTITDAVKSNAVQKAAQKVNDKINSGVDAALKPKVKPNKPEKPGVDSGISLPDTIAITSSESNTDSTNIYNTSSQDESNDTASTNVPSPHDGYISVITSANSIFMGGSVTISGESVMYGEFKSVGITIQGPYSEDANPKPLGGYAKQTKQVALDKDGKFKLIWNVGGIDGQFIITATSSDGKATKKKTVIVYNMADGNEIADSNISITNKVYENLVKRVEAVKPDISSADGADLDKKRNEVKEKKDELIRLYTSINDATSKLGVLLTKGKGLPPDLNANLSDLHSTLAQQAAEMEKMEEFNNHEPTDNTICEYLVMVNEACAAFSTVTALYGGSLVKILSNIVTGNVVPRGIEMENNTMGKPVDPDMDITAKEPAKLFAAAAIDAKSVVSGMGATGVAGDLVQFASGFLLKKYCGIYGGILKHDYRVIFRNADHAIWWDYSVEMEATVSLRYPKNKTGGKVLKMKGNVEGNATKFKFFANAKEAVKDEMKGRDKYVEVLVLKDFLPLAVPFATSQYDSLGFGVAARAATTPAYFNIPIDADYDQDAGKIKFFVNPALVDFSDLVSNRELFMVMAVLPLVRWQDYPIFKAQETFKGSFKEKNEFTMVNSKLPSCNDKVTRHINDQNAAFEIFLNTSFKITKQ
jgi:hypothetical protein